MPLEASPPPGLLRPEKRPSSPLPDLAAVFRLTPEATARHEQALARRVEKQRRREQAHEAALADASQTPRPSDLLRDAERNMDAGSRVAARAQLRDELQQRAHPRGAFRETLAKASEKSPAAPAPARAEPAATPAAGPAGRVEAKATALPPTTNVPAVRGGPAATTPHTAGAVAQNAATSPANGPHAVPVVARVGHRLAVGGATPTVAAGATRAAPNSAGAAVATASRPNSTPARHAAAPAPQPADGESDANMARVVRVVQAQLAGKRAAATLRLDPPELGTLRLHLDLRNDQLTLLVDTQTAAAQRLLETQLDRLRRDLDAVGIQLRHVEVRGPDGPVEPSPHGDVAPDGHGSPAQADARSADDGPQGEPASEPGQRPSSPTAEPLVDVLA